MLFKDNQKQTGTTASLLQDTAKNTNQLTRTEDLHTDQHPALSREPGTEKVQVPRITQRTPIVIPAPQKTSTGTGSIRPPKGRRIVIHATSSIALVLVVFGILSAVHPVDTHGQTGMFGIFKPNMKSSITQQQKTALITAQIATATAVTQDGYDAGNKSSYAFVNTTPKAQPTYTPPTPAPTTASTSSSSSSSSGSGIIGDPQSASTSGTFVDNFTPGQCTDWAAQREYQLFGLSIPWIGNAYQWSYNAPSYGWQVSSTPRFGSIIVLQPGVQGAGSYGHVAVVERVNSDGSVYTSDYNWNGEWGVVTYVTFQQGSGVSFIYP
jgi:surface antigen